jgi:hypothetical protein
MSLFPKTYITELNKNLHTENMLLLQCLLPAQSEHRATVVIEIKRKEKNNN